MSKQACSFSTLLKHCAFLASLVVTFAQPALSAIVLPVTYRGWVLSDGRGNGASDGNNFLARQDQYNNWFGFDLAAEIPASITSAKLYLFNNGYWKTPGVWGSGIYTIYDVSPTSQTILNSGDLNPGVSVFSDLGSGTSYGSTSFSTNDNGHYMIIELNASGLSDLQSAWGSSFFSIGGAATGVGATFNYSDSMDTYLEIASNPVPEPATWGAAALLIGTAGFVRWRKHNVSSSSHRSQRLRHTCSTPAATTV